MLGPGSRRRWYSRTAPGDKRRQRWKPQRRLRTTACRVGCALPGRGRAGLLCGRRGTAAAGIRPPGWLGTIAERRQIALTDCTSEIRGRSFSNATSISRFTLSTDIKSARPATVRWIHDTSHLIPGTAALSRDMRHEETWSPTALTVRLPPKRWDCGWRCTRTYLTLPMPATILAQGVESLF